MGEIAIIKAGGDCPLDFSKVRTGDYNVPIFSNGIGSNSLYGYGKTPIIRSNSVTVAARGTIGYCVRRKANYIPIIRLLSVVPITIGGDIYLYHIINGLKFGKNGSVQQQLTVPQLSNIKIPYPTEEELTFIEVKIRPIINKIQHNEDNSILLAKKRNELLPLLMNGQVSVS